MRHFIRRWFKRRELRRRLDSPTVQEIDGLGTCRVYAMLVPMRLVLQSVLADESHDSFDVYCWLIQECVYEYAAMPDIGVRLSPGAIEQLGNAVLTASGLTKAAQEDAVKKSESSQN